MTERRGRVAERPAFTTSSGYQIAYRYLSPDVQPRLRAAAEKALADQRPPMPTQRMETGPGEFQDVENPHDPTYQEALAAWQQRVQAEAGQRFLRYCETYALIYEVDSDEVAALKAAHAAVDDPIDGESDAAIFLWRIALPTPDDQMLLMGKLFGGLTEEAIQAQKASFRRQLPGAARGGGAAPAAEE